MKRRISYAMLLLIFGCSVNTPNNNKKSSKIAEKQEQNDEIVILHDKNKLYKLEESSIWIDSISKSEYQILTNKPTDFLNRKTKTVKVDNCIRIVNRLGTVVREYRDSLVETDDTDQKMYSIAGEFKKEGITVLLAQYYETGECILVDNETGNETVVWGIPKMSLDGKYLFVATCALGYDDIMPNGFQIWELKQHNILKLLIETREKEWCINEFYWISQKSLAIETKEINGKKHYLKILF